MNKSFYLRLVLFQIYFTFTPQKVSLDPAHQLIVWNVGQGQWVTYVKNNQCIHIDSGGEFFPGRKIKNSCAHANNYFYFTHADKDHINFFPKATKLLNNNWLIRPQKILFKKWKSKKWQNKIANIVIPEVSIIYKPVQKNKTTPNQSSKVFIIDKTILISGDSEKKNEQDWGQNKKIDHVRYFILGHHGSNTSNSNFLIGRLKKLKLAVSSSRKSRYGHPHGLVKKRFNEKNIPLVTTDVWGSIVINL